METLKKILIVAVLLFFGYSCVDLISGAECNPDKGQTCSVAPITTEVPPTPVTNTTTNALNATESIPENGWAKNIHVVNAKARAFDPAIVYIEVGDVVKWINMTSHNVRSIIVPGHVSKDGNWVHEGFKSNMGENYSYKFIDKGIYGYVCEPHIGFGMVGFVVVGETKQEDIDRVKNAYVVKDLRGPYRRLIGKLNKIVPWSPND